MKRLKQNGKNILPRTGERISKLTIFFSQWKSPLIIILIVAGAVSGFLHEYVDMSIIFATVVINVVIGFIQEYKANQALKKLQSMVTYKAVVMRGNKKIQIDSEDLVPGDILVISPGDNIQADGRLLHAKGLQVIEAALTGESEPIQKSVELLRGEKSLGDRINMVYRGTMVADGEGMAVIVATGAKTEIGKIATLVSDTSEDRTPLQIQLGKLSKWLGIIISITAAALIVLGVATTYGEYSLFELFETAVAVAVAAIPEGLVISLTVILAIGMQHILTRKALVRKLVAAETLGSVSVICSDKTGTLTEGVMRVNTVYTANEHLSAAELVALDMHDVKYHAEALFALRIGMLCNNASLQNPDDKPKEWKFLGDTTEVALLNIGERIGMQKTSLDNVYERMDEIPFSSERKYMATLHHGTHGIYTAIKGAPETILNLCTSVRINEETKKLTSAKKKVLSAQVDELSEKGLRVLALAYRDEKAHTRTLSEGMVKSLVFVGLVGIRDPLRSDVKETIRIAQKAGIHVAMITGDHKKTAAAIARELGMSADEDNILEGAELDTMDEAELAQAIAHTTVFARVNPKHKIDIVRAFQKQDQVVAMTGDGVNDAPALKGSDIGIALGSGTDVAKETSDIVLLDDSFSTIVSAIEEGRQIYQNIKKTVLYLLAGTFAEVSMIAGSIILGLPIAALPAQILWINIVEDTFLNIALAFDKGDRENMQDPPRPKGEKLIDREMKVIILAMTIISNIALFIIYYYVLNVENNLALARTMVFVGFGIDSLFLIFSVRSLRHMVWKMNPFDNKVLLACVAYGWVMIIAAVHVPFIQYFLRTVPMGAREWTIMIAYGIGNMVLIEIVKWIFIVRKNISAHVNVAHI